MPTFVLLAFVCSKEANSSRTLHPCACSGGCVLTSLGSTALQEPSAALHPLQVCSEAPYQVSYMLDVSHKCSPFPMCSCTDPCVTPPLSPRLGGWLCPQLQDRLSSHMGHY